MAYAQTDDQRLLQAIESIANSLVKISSQIEAMSLQSIKPKAPEIKPPYALQPHKPTPHTQSKPIPIKKPEGPEIAKVHSHDSIEQSGDHAAAVEEFSRELYGETKKSNDKQALLKSKFQKMVRLARKARG